MLLRMLLQTVHGKLSIERQFLGLVDELHMLLAALRYETSYAAEASA
jgi:hypothetical protein